MIIFNYWVNIHEEQPSAVRLVGVNKAIDLSSWPMDSCLLVTYDEMEDPYRANHVVGRMGNVSVWIMFSFRGT